MITAYIIPDWPCPNQVRAFTTSKSVGDFSDNALNPDTLKQLNLPSEPIWLTQVHQNSVLSLDISHNNRVADASFTTKPNTICVIRTADCLPILLTSKDGNIVAAIHGGWRGLAQNIISKTIEAMRIDGIKLIAWLGPAIGADVYEIGEDFYTSFVAIDPTYKAAFKQHAHKKQKWLANICHIATLQLHKCGISSIYGGGFCTYTDNQRFYSHRRQGKQAGRMASLIWIEGN